MGKDKGDLLSKLVQAQVRELRAKESYQQHRAQYDALIQSWQPLVLLKARLV